MERGDHIAVIEGLKAENSRALDRAARAEEEAALYREKLLFLEHELAQLRRLIFSAKSERFVPAYAEDQMPLFEAAAADVAPPPTQKITYTRSVKKKPVRQVLPAHLARREIIIEPEIDTIGLKKIGEEVTETLDYVPGTLIVLRRVRPKYVDPADEAKGVAIGPLPPRPVDKGIAEAGLLAHVVIEKYTDHLPIYRQVERFKREGITLAASTIGDWTRSVSELIEPLYGALKEEALESGYLQADETPIKVLDPKKKGKTHRGYYWVYHAPLSRIVLMEYQPGRGRDGPTALLATYRGALQTDGYRVYDDYDKHPHVTTHGCWAHARRYFFDAEASAPEEAEHVLKELGRLYEVERELREGEASHEERRSIRQETSLPILKRIKVYLESHPGLPKSPWDQGASYTLSRWDKLERYTEDGRIEIDNNLVENAIRPIALGRKKLSLRRLTRGSPARGRHLLAPGHV